MEDLTSQIQTQLPKFKEGDVVWVAYSGGVDSHVLLHILAKLRHDVPFILKAIHVNHQINRSSAKWAKHCQSIAAQLQVECYNIPVSITDDNSQSLEARARFARYEVFTQLVQKGQWLCLAHHQQDQVETVLLKLFRGSGVKGLAAMRIQSVMNKLKIIRPLLNSSKASITEYAQLNHLRWVEDSSNHDLSFDRNYLRKKIMPVIESKWPGINKTVSRSAMLFSEANYLLEEFIQEHLNKVLNEERNTLKLEVLAKLSAEKQKLIIRSWLYQMNFLLPSYKKLNEISKTVINAREDANPLVKWSGCEIRRFKNELYAMTPLEPHDPTKTYRWQGIEPFSIQHLGTKVEPECLLNRKNLRQDSHYKEPLTIRFRQGGETCHLAGQQGTRKLKKLMQAVGIPPWERNRIPLVYYGETLISVVGYFECDVVNI